MPNYPTSCYKKPKGAPRSYVVTYEEDLPTNDGKVITFGVMACSLSEATAMTIHFIEKHGIHQSHFGYTLFPKLSKEKTDYIATLSTEDKEIAP